MNAKPSQVHSNPELLKMKAAQANTKRKERLEQKKADENIRRRNEARARQAAEEAKAVEEAKTAEEAKAAEEQPKPTKNTIKIVMNGIEYKTLTDAVITLPGCSNQRGEDGLHSHYTVSMWNKINRQLKKTGEFTMDGYYIKKI